MDGQHTTLILQAFLADPKNREAFGRFTAKYQPRIKRRCLRRGLQDADAEDLTATLLLRFCERDIFDQFVFRTKEQFAAWLNTVVRNAALTFLRDRDRRPGAWSVGNADAQEALQRVAEGVTRDLGEECADDLARVEVALTRVRGRVEDRTWEAFRLSVYDGLGAEAVATRLGVNKASVWQAVARIKRLARQELPDLLD